MKIRWHVAIFDEAHKLKNRASQIYAASCGLDTKLRYGLTGTAMQVELLPQLPCFYCCCCYRNDSASK